MKEKKRISIWDIGYYVGVGLLLFVFFDILLSSILLIIHKTIVPEIILISLIIPMFIGLSFLKKNNKIFTKEIIISIVFAILILLFSFMVAGKFYDVTYDGNAYHKLAIGDLKNSWNPVYESVDDFQKRTDLELTSNTQSIWLDHYAKASWLYGASVYAFTNNIEMGKSINILFIVILFLLVNDYLRHRRIGTVKTMLISFICSVNPIMMVQVLSFYVDGILANTLFIIILSLIAINDKTYKRSKKLQWVILGMSISICANIKFTGLVYAGFFCLSFYLTKMVRSFRKTNRVFCEEVKSETIKYCFILVIAVGVIGSNSYIRNVIDHQNPFYPLLGKGKVDIITQFQPDDFEQTNPYKKFVLTTFSYTQNTSKDPIELKIPFTTRKSEFEIIDPDVRRGGWGPFFSGIFILSSVICVVHLIKTFKSDKDRFFLQMELLIPSILIMGLADGSWWARYSPYVYLLPLTALCLVCDATNKNSRLKEVASWLMIGLVLYNTYCMKNVIDYTIWLTGETVKSVNEMKKANKVEFYLKDKSYAGIIYNFIDEKINYEFTNEEYGESLRIWKVEYQITKR